MFITSFGEQNITYRSCSNLRIHLYATSLLSRTDYSLEQIADELGYSDVANFSRAFKRWSGRSPSNWRKDPYL